MTGQATAAPCDTVNDERSVGPTALPADSFPAWPRPGSLDAWVRECVAWHFDPATGTPFWLDYAARLDWDPRREIRGFAELKKFGHFQDDWLRGGPVRRWLPRGLGGQADVCLWDRRIDRCPQIAPSRSTTSASTTKISPPPCPMPPPPRQLAHARPLRPAAAAPGHRTPGPISRRHRLLRRSRPTLGHQGHQTAAKSNKKPISTNNIASIRR